MRQLTLFFLLISLNLSAQNSNSVEVKVIAKGNSEINAITEGLRSALTQASSVFITSNTEIINDELTKDQTSMINNGSIEKYQILNKTIKDNDVILSLLVTVSVSKLTNFVESKGGKSELKGGLFAANIKLQELNEKAELNAINDLIEVSEELLERSFDYKISNGQPVNKNGKWEVPLDIQISYNDNYNSFIDFFYQTLQQISLNQSDKDAYISLKKPLYIIGLFGNKEDQKSTPNYLKYNAINQNNHLDNLIFYAYNHSTDSLFKIISTSYGDLIKFGKNWSSKTSDGYTSSLAKEPYNVGPVVFTANKEKKFHPSLIYLRNKESYARMIEFVNGLGVIMYNTQIKNGVNQASLLEVVYGVKNENYKTIEPPMTNMMVSVYSAVGEYSSGLFDLYTASDEDFAISTQGSFARKIIGEFKNIGVPRFFSEWPEIKAHKNLLENTTWEKNMYNIENKLFFNPSVTEGTRGLIRGGSKTQKYFDFLFPNYIEYIKVLAKIEFEYGKNLNEIYSFPLQLTLIGNEQKVVSHIKISNYLTTDEISKVSTYLLERKK